VSTRRVDELMQAMGLTGISKSTVSKLCRDIDERVNAFLNRQIDGAAAASTGPSGASACWGCRWSVHGKHLLSTRTAKSR
jgi:hypothetical protein